MYLVVEDSKVMRKLLEEIIDFNDFGAEIESAKNFKEYQEKINKADTPEDQISVYIRLLQYHISTLIDNDS